MRVNLITLHYEIESGDKRYRVTRRDAATATIWECTCEDHQYRHKMKQCKHITAARRELRNGWIGTRLKPRKAKLTKTRSSS